MTKVIDFRKKRIKKSTTKINSIKVLDNFLEDKFKILFLFISIIGIFLGALTYKFFENEQFTTVISDKFILLNSGEYKAVFLYLLRIDLLFIIINFFVGTSFLGGAISFLSPLLKSLYIGYLSGYLYNEFELKGVLFCILFLFPCFAITSTSLIFTSNENIYMSRYIFNCLNDKVTTDNISMKLFLLRYLLLIIINLICIVLSSLFITFIAPKINII